MKFFSFLSFAMVLSMSHSQAQEGNWGDESVPYTMGPEKMTKLRFYFHDIITGKNPTAVQIAQATGTNSSATMFGALMMIDDPLTEGPDPNSRMVGRAQGFYGSAGQNELALILGMSLVFTGNEKFNGSTISVLSRNPVMHTEREFAIVGGTGYFQFARGFISAKTYSLVGPNAVVEYNCTIVHPSSVSDSGKPNSSPGKSDSSSGSKISLVSNLYFSLLVVAMVLSTTLSQADENVSWGDQTVPHKMAMEKMTRLHFYFHDVVTGDNPTAVRIAEARGTKSSSTMFGALYMIDDPLTEGPDPDSRLVGRAQGFYGHSGKNEMSLIMGMSLVFTANEKFNGSSISVFTRNPITHTDREFAIVGGTGYFQFARGYISGKTYRISGPDAIVEYNCTIIHY
ncbi:hypothetical protein MKW92_022768 [Papaver armeniacum]|nr:hypothetical protein MKW92_022768 [Papaver armeniacum]